MIYKALLTMTALLSMTVFADETTQQNKRLVVDFYNEVILQARHREIDNYIGEQYIQHNPNLPDGKDPLRSFLQRLNPESIAKSPSGKIIRAIAEGDLVVLHVEYFNWPTNRGGAVMDIFRVDEGKIVEHWDVIQAIPETFANDNTMF
ncbi:MAG: ester cyclase [Aestuariibacter sp.]